MAQTTPRMTWSKTTELVTASNAAAVLAAIKTQVLTTTWRVLADDLGAGDTYLWVAPAAIGPVNSDDRIFIYAGGGTIHANNLASLATSHASGLFVAYCPGHGGATPDATDPTLSTPISSTRWTKLYSNGYYSQITGVYCIVSDEALVLLCRIGTTDTVPAAFGPIILASDDTASEDGDGRVYGMHAGGFTRVPNNVWSYLVSGAYVGMDWGSDTNSTSYPRLMAFDPNNPNNLRYVSRSNVSLAKLNAEADMLQERPAGSGNYTRVMYDIPLHWSQYGPNIGSGVVGTLRQIVPERDRSGLVVELRSGSAGPVLEIIVVPSSATLSECTGYVN